MVSPGGGIIGTAQDRVKVMTREGVGRLAGCCAVLVVLVSVGHGSLYLLFLLATSYTADIPCHKRFVRLVPKNYPTTAAFVHDVGSRSGCCDDRQRNRKPTTWTFRFCTLWWVD